MTTARKPRINMHCYLTEMCRCGKHPRTVLSADVVVAWVRGFRINAGLDPEPAISTRPIPEWAR